MLTPAESSGGTAVQYRLVGSFGMISWMQSFHTASSPPRGGDTRLKAIEYLQAWTMLLYQPLENVWYLAYKGIVALPPGKRDRIGLWSCRCWAAYVVLYAAEKTDSLFSAFPLTTRNEQQTGSCCTSSATRTCCSSAKRLIKAVASRPRARRRRSSVPRSGASTSSGAQRPSGLTLPSRSAGCLSRRTGTFVLLPRPSSKSEELR